MRTTTILFDLDGTLLPMDQDKFIKTYFGALAKKLAPHGYEPQELIGAIWHGTGAMIQNNGEKLNKEVFFDTFRIYYGERTDTEQYLFDEFYEQDFDREVRESCGYDPDAAKVIKQIKDMGFKVALATNPLFPSSATMSRIRWAGLDREDFELVTTYDNSRHCKPNLDYYRDILNELGVSAEECLMVGNDVDEDMIADQLGMKVFLLPRDLINKQGADISIYPHGDFSALVEYVRNVNN